MYSHLQNSHFSYYLKPGMSILEFGAAEDSYLPDDAKLSRHVGVGLNSKLMSQNPSITESLVVDLNEVVLDKDVESDDLRALAAEPFDAIIMSNTIDFLTHPREVFRSAWNLLKPGGIMLVAFSTQKAYGNKFERAQTKMWRDFNDDQHMWITGSFFQFSAGDGWEKLLGFDISPTSAKDSIADNGPFDMFKQGKDNNVYVVQASKGFQDESISEEDPGKSINSKMWMLPTLESRDKQLIVPRLARAYSKAKTESTKKAIADNISQLPKIYDALVKMDQFAFTFQMQSQLATDLALDPDFNGNDDQILALRQGKTCCPMALCFAMLKKVQPHILLGFNCRSWFANAIS
jgi:SAM-dependent methyltransferase